MDVFPQYPGRIEVICGPMFSGKSEELVRRTRRCVYANQKTIIFSRDTRYGKGLLKTHSGNECKALFANNAEEILTHDLKGVDVIGIDEGQFFGDQLSRVCTELSSQNIRVIVAGLDMDFECKPFENIALLMGIAEHVTKLSAICMSPGCGSPATRSYRTTKAVERVLEGSKDIYIPLCRHCYENK